MHNCRCIARPPEGCFKPGENYRMERVIDGGAVYDGCGERFGCSELGFLWYFVRL